MGMRRQRQLFVERFGPELGDRLYHALQSQAAHAGVSARLRRKLEALRRGEALPPRARSRRAEVLPLFPNPGPEDDPAPPVAAPSRAG